MEENYQSASIASFVLLDSMNFDVAKIRKNLKKDWGIIVKEEKGKEVIVFEEDGMTVGVSHMPAPVPNKEAEENARLNFMWKDGVEIVSRHQSHILVTVFGGDDRLVDRYCLQTKVAASCLKLPDATAIYNNVTVLPAGMYIDFANYLKNDSLPVADWVLVGVYRNGEKWNAYTYGMYQFGKDEMEVVDSDMDGYDLYDFLLNIAEYVIGTDVELQDGETIGFSEEQKLTITRSEGVAVDGFSLKIVY